MKSTVRRRMHYRYYQSSAIEQRLENLAKQGLFLEQIGSFFWKFKRGEPRQVKYTVTYYSEASIVQPEETKNQETYFDYAREVGWNFVTQFNQMQVFISEQEHAEPFETDEREKLSNIKRCMNKSFLPSIIILILVFMLNVFVQYQSYRTDPTEFFTDTFGLFPLVFLIPAILYYLYILISYFVWCKQSERSIDMGNGCIEKLNPFDRVVDSICSIYFLGSGIWFLLHLASKNSIGIIFLLLLQIPILHLVFQLSITRWRKKMKSATVNKLISYGVVTGVSLAYMVLLITIVLRFDLLSRDNRPYRSVTWNLTSTESREYRLYSDDLPLTCEDLYGNNGYEYYSYEKTREDSVFLSRSEYRQASLPGRDAPPSIEYTVIEPKFDFVYQIVAEDLKKASEWPEWRLEPLDDEIFGTKQAYEVYLGMDSMGEYLLFYEDQIIVLNLEEPATEEQRAVIIEKLKLDERRKEYVFVSSWNNRRNGIFSDVYCTHTCNHRITCDGI